MCACARLRIGVLTTHGWMAQADPTETKNIAGDPANAALVAQLQAKLSSFQPYIPAQLSSDNLLCYNCTGVSWGGFAGPCCVTKPQ